MAQEGLESEVALLPDSSESGSRLGAGDQQPHFLAAPPAALRGDRDTAVVADYQGLRFHFDIEWPVCGVVRVQ